MEELPEPWELIDHEMVRDRFTAELARELSPQHVLYGKAVYLIARRVDIDDFLFRCEDGSGRYAIVHLTMSGKREPDRNWPSTRVFEHWTAVEAQIRLDNEWYS